jgi:hypothetical protein
MKGRGKAVAVVLAVAVACVGSWRPPVPCPVPEGVVQVFARTVGGEPRGGCYGL